jgi:hypothetical protein
MGIKAVFIRLFLFPYITRNVEFDKRDKLFVASLFFIYGVQCGVSQMGRVPGQPRHGRFA